MGATSDSTGYLKTVHREDDVNDIHWQATGMDARGNLTAYELDGGLKTYREYDAATGNLSSIDSLWGGIVGAVAQESIYQYDGLGNLTYRDNKLYMSSTETAANQDQGQTFTYDALNRLKSWTTRSFDGVGLVGQTKVMEYFNNGNIKSKANVGDYVYQQQGSCALPSGPHAVSYIQGKGQFCYDASGNMHTGDGKTFTYTSFDKPKTIVKGAVKTEFLYGPSLGRYKRTDTVAGETDTGTQKTWYLDGIYEKVEDKNGKVIERFFLGEFGLIERTESTVAGLYLEQARYFLKDNIGSVLAVVEGGSMRLLQQFHYDVWGKREYVKTGLGVNPWDSFGLSGRLGFTGHEMLDTVGLIHMNGRVYDPELARFVSADPIIQSPYNTQSYNRYSYVWNNPLGKIDPSGFGMLDAEHTNDPNDNHENDPRYDRENDDRNNQRVREENEAAAAAALAAEQAAIAAAKALADAYAQKAAAELEAAKQKAAEEASKKSIWGRMWDGFKNRLSGTFGFRGGKVFVGEIEITYNPKGELNVYVGAGLGLGRNMNLDISLTENVLSNNGAIRQAGFTSSLKVAHGEVLQKTGSVVISEGGVDVSATGGIGLGSYVGNTIGYTFNFDFN